MLKMPQARTRGLIIQEVDSEILIYDKERDKAHFLNETAAKVWKHCDGKTTVAAACCSLSSYLEAPVDEKLVWYAIGQFAKDHLLEEQIKPPASITTGMNRRQMVLRLGLAAVAVPLVTSIVAPTAAQAGGSPPACTPTGQACQSSAECCSLLCNAGTCA
jgi:hypothetical protein